MAVTCQRLLDELGNRAWSGFNKDDMVFGNEEADTAMAELNAAHRYLMAREDFPFQANIEPLRTIKNIDAYSMVEGQIAQIIDQTSFEKLEFIQKPKELEPQSGKPTGYYVDYSNPDANIILYPKPDMAYNFNIVYNTYKFILTASGEELNEFANADDFLNMPSYLEWLYMDCVILRTMETNNKDLEDENYQPIQGELQQAWENFLRKAQPAKVEQRIVI